MHSKTEAVRRKALELGFDACGFARAGKLDDEARKLETWLNEGRHGTMTWMENHFDKRVDPTLLVPGSKSVVSVLCNYHRPDVVYEEGKPKISRYALGEDYHHVLKSKLYALFEFTESLFGGLEGRVFVDSAPVLDKAWAVKSGLGWQGKNANLLNKNLGSWFFIGEMIVDAEFDYDGPTTDHCGTCTRCIDACPTDAIYEPYKVDSNRCISYLTIELREQIPSEYHEAMGNWMYGCDICQDVCPWNRKAPASSEPAFEPRQDLINKEAADWEELNLAAFRKLFKKSAIKRTRHQGLTRNIHVVAENLR